MYILLELGNGIATELCGDKNPVEFLKKNLSIYAFDEKMRTVLLAVGKCEIPTPAGHCYVARVMELGNYVHIYYTAKKNLQNSGQQGSSHYVAYLYGKGITPRAVENSIRQQVLASFAKELKTLANALEVSI